MSLDEDSWLECFNSCLEMVESLIKSSKSLAELAAKVAYLRQLSGDRDAEGLKAQLEGLLKK